MIETVALQSAAAAEQIFAALQLAREAIGILDRIQAPADIAAHLDMAVYRMEQLGVQQRASA